MDYYKFTDLLERRTPESEILKLLETEVTSNFLSSNEAITRALEVEYYKVVECLLSKGMRMDYADLKWFSCKEKALKMALDFANSFKMNKSDCKLLEITRWDCLLNAENICEILLKHGLDVNRVEHISPLQKAIETGKNEIIEMLLNYGANPILPSFPLLPFTPLRNGLNRPISMRTKELLVKYAALRVDSQDNRKLTEFYNNFKVRKTRSFLLFAQRCVEEVSFLKDVRLSAIKMNLYDFVMLQGESTKLYVDNTNITRNLLQVVASTPIPIYAPLILRKLVRKSIVDVLSELPLKWSPNYSRKHLDHFSVVNIFKFLCNKDLINLWLAVH